MCLLPLLPSTVYGMWYTAEKARDRTCLAPSHSVFQNNLPYYISYEPLRGILLLHYFSCHYELL